MMAAEQDELTQGITELFEAEEAQEPTEGTETPTEQVETQETVEEPEEETTVESEEPVDTDEPEPDQVAGEAETISINGVEYPKSELEKFAKVAQWVQENPKIWEQIEGLQSQYAEGQELTPIVTPEEEWVDPDTRLATMEGKLNALLQERQEQSSAQYLASVHDSVELFRRDHPELDEQGVTKVLQRVKEMRVMPTYLQKYPARPVFAAKEALEHAFRIEYYNENPKRQPVTTSEARARRKAASAAPSNVSTPRVPEIPETPEEAYKMMVEDIREAQRANT